MRIDQFLATVYLGDRACKAILLDGWNERVCVTVDEISRIRSASGAWEFNNDENVKNGALVFTGVKSASLSPSGPLPSDAIEVLLVEPVGASLFRVRFSILGTHPQSGLAHEMELEVVAENVHIEDPARPGVSITQ